MNEATHHLHINFIPFTTGSKRGLSTRVSLKQELVDQGITGEGRSLTERDLWVQKEKEALAAIMLEHGIEWEQKGEHKEHLSIMKFKREKRKEELAELEQTIERVQQQQVSIKAVEQIEAKLRTADLEQENDRLRKRIRIYEDMISRNNLWSYFDRNRETSSTREIVR